MSELTNWLMVFLRVSALLAVFPVFSTANFPVQLRLALGALVAGLVSTGLPPMAQPQDVFGWVGVMSAEVLIGLVFGFATRMIFFGLDMAGNIITTEIGLSLPPGIDPMTGSGVTAPGSILYYLAAVIWLSLDLHHWMLVGLVKTYALLPIGGAHLVPATLEDMVHRTSQTFVIGLQLAAPVLAVSFIVSLVFSVLGRAVPQLNAWYQSFTIRTLAGLAVFGMTLQLMAQHIVNNLQKLPEDMLTVAQLLGGR
jgi:flagellar biosynthetic protein FliR